MNRIIALEYLKSEVKLKNDNAHDNSFNVHSSVSDVVSKEVFITLHHITSHHITSHHITSHYITLHYITLHCITLHYITLHYITYCNTWGHDIPPYDANRILELIDVIKSCWHILIAFSTIMSVSCNFNVMRWREWHFYDYNILFIDWLMTLTFFRTSFQDIIGDR